MDAEWTVRSPYPTFHHLILKRPVSSSLGILLPADHLDNEADYESYTMYNNAWMLALPLVTEAVLFGAWSSRIPKPNLTREITRASRVCLSPVYDDGMDTILVKLRVAFKSRPDP